MVVQLLSCVKFFATSWTAACQASLSFTISQSLLKLMSIESVMPSYHPENYWKAIYIFEKILIEVYLIYNVSGVQQSDSVMYAAAAAAKSFQSCPTLRNPTEGSPPVSAVPGIIQARELEWDAIAFSSVMCVYIYFFRFFSGYYKILNLVSCAIQLVPVVIYFIYGSLYLLIPNS